MGMWFSWEVTTGDVVGKVRQEGEGSQHRCINGRVTAGATGTQSHRGPSDTQWRTCLSIVSLSHEEAKISIHHLLLPMVEGGSGEHLVPSTSGLPYAGAKHNPMARESP